MKTKRVTIWVIGVAVLILGISALFPISPVAAAPPPGALSGLTADDESFSANASVLVDGTESSSPADAWANSDNPWSDSSYPMSATIDLGSLHDVTAVHYYAGQVPFPTTAALDIETSADGTSYSTLGTATSPAYNAWSAPMPASVQARYVRVRFEAANTRFDVTEVAVVGTPVDDDDGGGDDDDDGGAGGGDGAGGEITTLAAADGDNSSNADRLTDDTIGANTAQAWTNPNPWNPDNFPMTAVIDLGGTYNITDLHYHVGNIFQPANNQIVWESSASETGPFVSLYTGTNHDWNDWREVSFSARSARRLQVTFNSQPTMFNLSEVKVFAADGGDGDPGDGDPGDPGDDPDDPGEDDPGDPGNDPVGDCQPPNHPGDAYCDSVNVIDSFGQQAMPQSADTGARWDTITTYYNDYGNRPGMCSKEIHNKYWTAVADDNGTLTYFPSWHPPIHDPGGSEECRFTHEHGVDPRSSDLYDEDHPTNIGVPFGFVHPSGGHGNGERVEDHVGHKVIVENDFQLTTNNPYTDNQVLNLFTLNGQTVTCDWYSKLHQGTHSSDALGFNSHEYFLNYSCSDGTEVRIKEMTDFGFRSVADLDAVLQNNPAADPEDWRPLFPLIGGGGTVSSDCGWFTTNFPAPAADSDLPGPPGNSNDSDFGDAKRGFTCLMGDAKTEELWKPSARIKAPGDHPTFEYDPYYVVMNSNRFALYDWWTFLENDGDHVGENAMISMVDFCVDGSELRNEVSRPATPDSFVKRNDNYTEDFRVTSYCNSIDPTVIAEWEADIMAAGGDDATLMAERKFSIDNPFVGTRRGVHTKGPRIYKDGGANFGSLSLFCTDHQGNNSAWPTNPNTGSVVDVANPWSAGDPTPVCNNGVQQLLSSVNDTHWAVEGSTAGATWNGSNFTSNGPAGEIVIDIDTLYPGHGIQAPN